MNYKDSYSTAYVQRELPPGGFFARIWKRAELDRQEAAFRLLDNGERFLDVGCGGGRLVFSAVQKFNEVYGTDISTQGISRHQETVKKLGRANINFQVADMNQRLPFEDSYFDAVSCIASFELPANPLWLAQEFNRVLRPGGTLIILTSNVAYIIYRVRALLGKPPRISSAGGLLDGGVLHYFTLSSLIALIEEAGFSVVKKGSVGKLWFLRNWWLSLLGSGLVIKAVKRAEINRTRL